MLHMLKTYTDTNWYREEGATAVEYAIMVVLIAVAIIVAVTALGGELSTLFQDTADTIEDANTQ